MAAKCSWSLAVLSVSTPQHIGKPGSLMEKSRTRADSTFWLPIQRELSIGHDADFFRSALPFPARLVLRRDVIAHRRVFDDAVRIAICEDELQGQRFAGFDF